MAKYISLPAAFVLALQLLACGGQYLPLAGGDDDKQPPAGEASCLYEGVERADGSSFAAGDGCNSCQCDAGAIACTEMACIDDPDPCSGAWLDQTALCRGADAEVLDAACCPDLPPCVDPASGEGADCPVGPGPEQALCERSGGSWDFASCGHCPCGQHTICAAVIPGCDCGAGRNFDPIAGCYSDINCTPIACSAGQACPAGSSCPLCPACDTCGVCLQTCEAIVCSFDGDCPSGSRCVGASLCATNALCEAPEQPGRCAAL